jgi:hypothetical protein
MQPQQGAEQTRGHGAFSVCLLGTSNGVIKNGYADYFQRSPALSHFDNHSLGASTSAFVFYRAPKVDFSRYEFCILDLCVNDGRWIDSGHVEPESWTQAVMDLCRLVLAAGCLPVLLILPSPNLLARSPEIQARARDVARRLNLPFFDGYDLLRQAMAARPGTSAEGFFRDPVHIHEWFGQHISRLLVESLPRLRAQRQPAGRVIQESIARHSLIDLTSQFAGETMTRGTSLVRENFALLTPRDGAVRFQVPPSSRAIALCLDQKSSHGITEVQGRQTHPQRLTNIYFSPDWRAPHSGMLFSFRPLTPEADVPEGMLGLRVLLPSAAKANPPSQLMLHGVVVRTPPQATKVPDLFTGETDMVRWVPSGTFAILADASLSTQAARTETRAMEH